MKSRENILVISLMFCSMTLVGVLINTYNEFKDGKLINNLSFNSIVLKSITVSFVILIVIILINYKKIKGE